MNNMTMGKDRKKACCPETQAVVHCGACQAIARQWLERRDVFHPLMRHAHGGTTQA
ncbi:MAG: hypothetical protein ACJ8G3_05490 [Burkholderiaceae bacterium]